MEKPRTREQKSRAQERAYHLLFTHIADHCVAHGIDLKMAMDKINKYEVAVTPAFVKSTWRSILKAQTGKESTAEQTKEDVRLVQRDFAELWRNITGESINWPSIDRQAFETLGDNQ